MERVKLLGFCLVLVIIASLLMTGCAGSPTTAAPATSKAPASTTAPLATTSTSGQVFNLTYSIHDPSTSNDAVKISVPWINWIEKQSGGRIKITLIPNAQAAGPSDQYDAARTGVVNIAKQGYSKVGGRFPLHELGQLPFLYPAPDARSGALTLAALEQKYPEFQAEQSDVKVLYYHHLAGGHINTIKKPVHTMEDMKGLQLVTFGTYGVATMKALGAQGLSIAQGEIYDALSKRVADGIDSALVGHMTVTKTDDMCNYTTIVGTIGGDQVVIMNMDTWKKLPPDLQKLFDGDNAIREMNARGYDYDLTEEQLRTQLDVTLKKRGGEGVYVLPKIERDKWVEACKPIYEDWVKKAAVKVGEAKAREILADAVKINESFAYTEASRKDCAAVLHDWGVTGY